MNTELQHCTCRNCVGAACTCGCQTPPVVASTCQCGCQQGNPCVCGPTVRIEGPSSPVRW